MSTYIRRFLGLEASLFSASLPPAATPSSAAFRMTPRMMGWQKSNMLTTIPRPRPNTKTPAGSSIMTTTILQSWSESASDRPGTAGSTTPMDTATTPPGLIPGTAGADRCIPRTMRTGTTPTGDTLLTTDTVESTTGTMGAMLTMAPPRTAQRGHSDPHGLPEAPAVAKSFRSEPGQAPR